MYFIVKDKTGYKNNSHCPDFITLEMQNSI